VDGARATARESWRESIDASMPGLDGLAQLANVLSQLGENPAQVEKLRRAATELRALSKELPDQSAPGKATGKITVIKQALASLLGDSRESGDVRNFIEMAAGGGAPVTALTPAVMDWMGRKNTTGSFKIVSGRPVSE
jgi:DNA polymerase/3'-5' exonuclease PolX